MTDLDRLHAVVEGKLTGRRVGRTYAACHNLAGILETCEAGSKIVWFIPRMAWLFHIRPMVTRVLEEHGLPIRWWYPNRLQVGFCVVTFMSLQDPYAVRERAHLFDYVVNDLGEAWDHVDNRLDLE
jgi:hypothetical protein